MKMNHVMRLSPAAPAATEKLQRILEPGGKFIFVTPGPKHLFEMKAVYMIHHMNIMEDIILFDSSKMRNH